MATIHAQCPDCGDVYLPSSEFTLMVCSTRSLSFYSFTCPECAGDVRKPADDAVISLLLSGGVVALSFDRAVVRDGPALTADDEIVFGLALEAAGDVAAVALAELARSR